MTVFYRGPGVRITHARFEVWSPTYRWFAIRDLRQVQVVERLVDPAPVGPVRAGSTGVAGAAAVAVAVGSQTTAPPALALALLALLAGSVAVSGACWRVRRVRQELVAVHRGRLVRLYRGTDPRTFGQVRRALTRALEQAGDGR
jgi:hypothetical protein